MTVGELTARLSASELVEWMAYFDLEPPDQMADWRNAQLQDTICRANGIKGTSIKQFMPVRKKPNQAAADQIAALKGLTNG